jgi:predicted GTPase
VDADVIVAGTPIDLGSLLDLRLPVVRARYAYAETASPGLGDHVAALLESWNPRDAAAQGGGVR